MHEAGLFDFSDHLERLSKSLAENYFNDFNPLLIAV